MKEGDFMTRFSLFSIMSRSICFAFLLSIFAGNGFSQTDYLDLFLKQNGRNSTFLVQPQSVQKLEKARRVNQILQELEMMRENFLQTGDFIDIFPTVYYHVTLKEFEYVLSDKFQNPNEIMDLIINFYEIYKTNRQGFFQRGIDGVEKQWREYYQRVISGNDYRRKSTNLFKPLILLWKIKRILQSGFAGHITFDLPCAVSRTLQFTEADKDSIYNDFRLSDAIMGTADDRANRDISQTLFKNSRTFAKFSLNLGARFIFLEHKINRMRVAAWNLGSGGKAKLCQFN